MKIYAEFPFDRQEPGRLIWPDSCWLLSDRPMYIPDFAPGFSAIPALAAKTGRLGKNVARRFATRYVAEWTAALIILPRRAFDTLAGGGTPPAGDWCFDNAVIIGRWQPAGDIPPLHLDVRQPGADAVSSHTLHPDMEPLLTALCNLSHHNTIKMGDVILSPFSVNPIPLSEQTVLTISADTLRQSHILSTRFR